MAANDRMTLVIATIAFFAVAGLTWFFSYRPRLFIRVFVPAEELRGAVHGILHDPHFCRAMRIMAGLQAVVATAIGLAAVWSWFATQ